MYKIARDKICRAVFTQDSGLLTWFSNCFLSSMAIMKLHIFQAAEPNWQVGCAVDRF